MINILKDSNNGISKLSDLLTGIAIAMFLFLSNILYLEIKLK